MDEDIMKLMLALKEKTPTLLLGAGFSIGAKNYVNNSLPTAKQLTDKLYEEFFVNSLPEREIYEEDINAAKEYKAHYELKDMCSLLAEEGRRLERNSFITTCFKGAKIEDSGAQNYLVRYNWHRIFTLNIDDLVEYIYRENSIPLNVWSREKADRKNSNGHTILIKLHGSVLREEEGYIFDEEEYINFYNETSYLLHDFADAYVKGDMIFVGTEFQEDDLKQIISKYETSGYDTSMNNYFFISPKINDPILRRRIKEKNNYYHIKWTTEQFLEFVNQNVNEPKEIKQELMEKGMLILDDYQKNMDLSYKSKLYTGREPRIEDFSLDWDILHPGLDLYLRKIESHKGSVVASIVGKNYVGKTCFAYRVLTELWKKGYYSFKFEMKSSEYMHLFLEYIKTFPDGTNVAVLFEDAAFYYSLLYMVLIKNCPSNIGKIVIVTTETEHNYYIRKDILKSNNAVVKFEIRLDISKTFANNIYSKLIEKQWLNRPEIHGSTAKEIKQYAVAVNDIIAFLYNITNGRGFEQHYEDLIMKSTSHNEIKYLQMMSLLSQLGITKIPQRIFPQLLIEQKRSFDMRKFANDFEEIILIENSSIKLRCQRLLQTVLMRGLTFDERKLIIVEVVKQVTGQFQEGDINEWTEIFQKVLSVKALLNENILELHRIKELLNEIEECSKGYSYYWIQRGLAEQKEKEFDVADNYFRKAIAVRSQSYQAHHALAKNLMERALDLLEKSDGYAPYYMDEGEKEIKEIILNPAFSRGLVYSLHSFIDMKLKYCIKGNQVMEKQDIEFMVDNLILIPQDSIDSYMRKVIDELIKYANNNNMGDIIYKLVQHDFGNMQEGGQADYEIENQDFLDQD